MTDHKLKVQLLLTGNEIMSGDTVDSNSALIARRLGELAIGVHRKVTVGDEVQLLKSELTDGRGRGPADCQRRAGPHRG